MISLRVQHIKKDFDVGYVQGTNLISIRTSYDVSEIWNNASKGSTTLCCDGLKSTSRKRKTKDTESDDSSGEDVPELRKRSGIAKRPAAKTKLKEKAEEIVSSLKKKNMAKILLKCNYRTWGEMVAGSLYSSLDTAPVTSMFVHAGGSTPTCWSKHGKGSKCNNCHGEFTPPKNKSYQEDRKSIKMLQTTTVEPQYNRTHLAGHLG